MTGRPAWNRSFTGKTIERARLLAIAADPEVGKRFLREK
jgi:hypothetical protein